MVAVHHDDQGQFHERVCVTSVVESRVLREDPAAHQSGGTRSVSQAAGSAKISEGFLSSYFGSALRCAPAGVLRLA